MAGRRQNEIIIACELCDATGLLADNDPTVGVVCAQCSGRGFRVYLYSPFSGRKLRPGTKRVRRAGQGISAFAPEPSPDAGVSYQDFLNGKLP